MDLAVILKALPEIVTQLLAFLIVFWVLKRFAFGPILGAIDERRKKIIDEFTGIEDRKRGLEDLEKEYRRRLEHIEEAARAKIQEAAALGGQLARDIQDKARDDARRLVERARAEIENDLKQARLSLRDEIVDLSGLITERILKETIDPPTHKKLVDRFIQEIGRFN